MRELNSIVTVCRYLVNCILQDTSEQLIKKETCLYQRTWCIYYSRYVTCSYIEEICEYILLNVMIYT